jgi:hypothetical protein
MNFETHPDGMARRSARTLAVWTTVLLSAALLFHGGTGAPQAHAATGARVPAATLDTAHGPYVIGEPPGRVEVLFFSFPG